MKAFLTYPDRDLDLEAELPSNADALRQDLGLDVLLRAMAAGDDYLHEVAVRTIFASLTDVAEIRYRQAVLTDCLANPDVTRDLYDTAVEAVKLKREFWIYSERYPGSLLNRSVQFIEQLLVKLRHLREVATLHAGSFTSPGFTRLFDELQQELDEEYLQTVEDQLHQLRFPTGVLMSASMGATNTDTNYVLRRRTDEPSWRERLGLGEPDSLTWELPPRDDAGADALNALRNRGIALAAAAVGESADHILSYFKQLQAELGFLVACLNLRDVLTQKGEPSCMPEAVEAGREALSARGLYDINLSLATGSSRVVGSDLLADGKALLVVTGANRGGKSTFLRSLGIAQLLMQAGMFVPAESFRADVRRGLFTHFKREEDVELRSGKLDEELSRMSGIVDQLEPDSLVLLNESFASTNEREGSEIGRQIVRALLENGMKVAYVTHMYDLASSLREETDGEGLFLRAERLRDARRTFRVVEGEPLPTSHGQDIYHRTFGSDDTTDAGEAQRGSKSPVG